MQPTPRRCSPAFSSFDDFERPCCCIRERASALIASNGADEKPPLPSPPLPSLYASIRNYSSRFMLSNNNRASVEQRPIARLRVCGSNPFPHPSSFIFLLFLRFWRREQKFPFSFVILFDGEEGSGSLQI